jgi:hypothetical protein
MLGSKGFDAARQTVEKANVHDWQCNAGPTSAKHLRGWVGERDLTKI